MVVSLTVAAFVRYGGFHDYQVLVINVLSLFSVYNLKSVPIIYYFK